MWWKIERKISDEKSIKFEEEIEEVLKIGRFEIQGPKPIKVTLHLPAIMEELLERMFMLKGDIYIKKSLNEEERYKLQELKEEAGMKNEERTEDIEKRGGE